MQKRATKLVVSLKKLSYEERLRKLNLPTLKFRRLRGDMIEVYKIVTGKYGKNNNLELKLSNLKYTKGNQYKLYQNQSKFDIRKYFFSNRVVEIWNSLPNYVVEVNSIILFKQRLDKFWSSQEVLYNFEAELEGTGSRSEVY